MKLKNKKTGEIVEFRYLQSDHIAPLVLTTYENDMPTMYSYGSLAELNEEWEDYEEPKEYYFIRDDGSGVGYSPIGNSTVAKRREKIGNYFSSREEAEKAVEKLKAWKRLKDNGFKYTAYQLQELNIKFFLDHGYTKMGDDLDLLFGGEE